MIRINKCIWCTDYSFYGTDLVYSFLIPNETKSVQYFPKLLINGVLVPCVKMGDFFRYLGRYFNMSNHQYMSELTSLLQDQMSDNEMKLLHPKIVVLLYSRYVFSKSSWNFTVADISKTWVIENIDSTVNGFIRKWLDIPISGTLSNVFLERNKFGLNICPPSIKFIQCQTVPRNYLKKSRNDFIKDVWKFQAATLTFNTMYTNLLKKFLKIAVLINKINCYTT